jgi:prepilin-type N-terminal cleavage/methylation domain-containing protein
MRHANRQRGFSLIEMMVVVAIIAILSALVIGLNGRTYGANSQNTAQELAGLFNTCRMRAVSTRRWHRCEVTATGMTMSQWSATGLTVPSGTCTPPATNCWQPQTVTPFGTNVIAWSTLNTPDAVGGQNPSQNTGFPYDMDFRPDGSSVGGTIYISDPYAKKPWRTLVYKATGGSYARIGW